jgi:hypothetical protein
VSPLQPGNTGQSQETDYRVDPNGNLNTQLGLLCNNAYGVITGFQAPGSCG